jgi:alkylation response protein AidB-like acyl-CoA dehydrogenase
MAHAIFTEAHDELRGEIRRYVDAELAPHTEEWERETFPDSVFRQMGALGYLGLDKPVEYGGRGLDYYSSLVLAEELYRGAAGGLAMAVAVQTDMAMPPIAAFGTEAQKQQWMVPAITGEKILCLGITEPDAGSDVAAIKTHAKRDGDEWVINGAKTYITSGHRADVIVLVTRTDKEAGYGGFTLFLVPMDAPGVVRENRLEKLGMHASDTSLLAFQDVRVPGSAVLGEVGKGFYQIMWQLQGERIIGAAGNLATAERALELTVDSMRARSVVSATTLHSQFARHRIAEMATKLEASRALTYATARRFADGEYPVRDVSMAKLHMGGVTNEILDGCFQLTGQERGNGIERMLRDVRLNRIGGGTDEILRDVIGKGYGL